MGGSGDFSPYFKLPQIALMAEVFPNLVKTTKPGNPKNVKQKKGEANHIIELNCSKTSDNEIILKAVREKNRHIINKGTKIKM